MGREVKRSVKKFMRSDDDDDDDDDDGGDNGALLEWRRSADDLEEGRVNANDRWVAVRTTNRAVRT